MVGGVSSLAFPPRAARRRGRFCGRYTAVSCALTTARRSSRTAYVSARSFFGYALSLVCAHPLPARLLWRTVCAAERRRYQTRSPPALHPLPGLRLHAARTRCMARSFCITLRNWRLTLRNATRSSSQSLRRKCFRRFARGLCCDTLAGARPRGTCNDRWRRQARRS